VSSISPIPGEYTTLEREHFYAPDDIERIAKDYCLDLERFAQALDDVVASYDDAGHWHARYPLWLGAKEKAIPTLSKLKQIRRTWSRANQGIKQTIAASFENYSAEVMLAQIDNLIAVMQELAETKGRERGNPGTARKSAGVDLRIFVGCVEDLNHFWRKEKGQPLGHEVEYDHYRERDGKVETFAIPRSHGIKFLHACLSRLDDHITIESCRTLLRGVKRRRTEASS
jgi:hypothetical protein